jgi:hypothetical protein
MLASGGIETRWQSTVRRQLPLKSPPHVTLLLKPPLLPSGNCESPTYGPVLHPAPANSAQLLPPVSLGGTVLHHGRLTQRHGPHRRDFQALAAIIVQPRRLCAGASAAVRPRHHHPTSLAAHRSFGCWPSATTALSSRAARLLQWSFRCWHGDWRSCPGFLDIDGIVISFLDRTCEASWNQRSEKRFTMTSNYPARS